MTEHKKVKHEKGEFQLEFPEGTPGSLKMIGGAAFKWANELDTDGNEQSDVAQYGPLIIEALPLLVVLYEKIDWKQVETILIHSGAIANEAKKEVSETLLALAAIAAKAK